MYDMKFDADDFPSYTATYKTVHDICEEQRSIVDERADLLLSSVFCALARLKELKLSFCEALEENDRCILRDDVIIKDEFYQHHLQVITNAIQNSRSRCIAIHTISLLNLALPYSDTWKNPEPDLSALSKALRQLLGDIRVLLLHGFGCVLKLLSHFALDPHQLDMYGVKAAHTALTDFSKQTRNLSGLLAFTKRVSSHRARG
jgi:hypothetical protein